MLKTDYKFAFPDKILYYNKSKNNKGSKLINEGNNKFRKCMFIFKTTSIFVYGNKKTL